MPSLLPYQMEDQLSLLDKKRVIIAYETGLGKTVLSLSCLPYGKTLVVCPKSLMPQWGDMIAYWQPGPKLWFPVLSPVSSWRSILNEESSIALINYAQLHKFRAALMAARFTATIFDEAHFLLNRKSQRSKAARDIARMSEHVYSLSATPKIHEPWSLWHLLHITDHKQFSSYWRFFNKHASFFILPGRGAKVPIGIKNNDRYMAEIGPYIIRRKRLEELPDLPETVVKKVRVRLTAKEWNMYELVRKGELSDSLGVIPMPNILTKLNTLRKLATSSQLITDLDAECTKADHAVEIVKSISTLAIIFTHFRATKKLVLSRLKHADIKACDLADLDKWRSGECQVLVETVYKGGLGLNLQEASDLIFVEPPSGYNSYVHAIGRLPRPGAKHAVQFRWQISSATTVDDYFWRRLDNMGMQASEADLALQVWKDLVSTRRKEMQDESFQS